MIDPVVCVLEVKHTGWCLHALVANMCWRKHRGTLEIETSQSFGHRERTEI